MTLHLKTPKPYDVIHEKNKDMKKRLITICINNGMFASQAISAIEFANKEIVSAVNNLDDDSENGYNIDIEYDGYPDIMYMMVFNEIKPVILNWINEEEPKAWYKQMFIN